MVKLKKFVHNLNKNHNFSCVVRLYFFKFDSPSVNLSRNKVLRRFPALPFLTLVPLQTNKTQIMFINPWNFTSLLHFSSDVVYH